MRKSTRYLLLGVAVAGAGMLATWVYVSREPDFPVEQIVAGYRDGGAEGRLTIRYPLDGTLFPPELVPPTFRWEENDDASDAWIVTIEFADASDRISFPCFDRQWTPSPECWETIKRRSLDKAAKVTILGVDRAVRNRVVAAAGISFRTSRDGVEAPIFYREVDLPFITAVRDPAAHICWRFGAISSPEQPPVVLDKLPVCGNCHSFSSDGSLLGMDVDYANDKGSYAIHAVAEEIVLQKEDIITWGDYKKEDGEMTFGLLSQVSPDGRYVASTVKDLSIFVPRDDLEISQLFFPIKGILVIYDRQTGEFRALPGADDPQYVQSNPSWSPDGKHLVFARSKVHQLKNPRKRKTVLISTEECSEFLDRRELFKFDLYRIAFNEGRGGEPKPLAGASQNGRSNYFARYSPDGKWIVFCQAESFMLLQPDSELFIIPAEGGEARRLECNTPRMNSWHSFSPNGRWLVFSSKWESLYTRLFLTHLDEAGHTSPPVLLSQFTAPDRAANIPEFVNARPGAIRRIREQFVDDSYYLRSAEIFRYQNELPSAVRDYRKALELNPRLVDAHVGLAATLRQLDQPEEAKAHLLRAVALDPDDPQAHEGLGNLLADQGKLEEAADSFRETLRIDPERAPAHFRLGVVLMDLGNLAAAEEQLAQAVRLDPDDPKAAYSLGVALRGEGKLDQAVPHLCRAVELAPKFPRALLELAAIRATAEDPKLRNGAEAAELAERACRLTRRQDPTALVVLAQAYAEMGRFPQAVAVAEQALAIVLAQGNEGAAGAIREQIELFQRRQPFRQSRG